MRKCLLLVLILSLIACAAMAAKPKPKPTPKPAPKPSVQLAGDKGVFGTVYSIRKDNPLYFRLKSAEYTTQQVVIGDELYVPKADEKLLVLHFTIQNPQKTEQFVRWDSLKWNAVDSDNNNHEEQNDWGNDDTPDHPRVEMNLQPAQTKNVITALVVPAKGSTPKLMVLPGENNGPILRYMLYPDPTAPSQNKPGTLAAPVADPKDTNGYTALQTVKGAVGTAYPYNDFDVTVEKFEYTTDKVGDYEPEEGGRLLLVTALIKNEWPREEFLRWDSFAPTLATENGDSMDYKDMYSASAPRSFQQNVKPLGEARVRMIFSVPKDMTPGTLTLKEDESRTYEFPVPAQ